jgi:hypothetical protein
MGNLTMKPRDYIRARDAWANALLECFNQGRAWAWYEAHDYTNRHKSQGA